MARTRNLLPGFVILVSVALSLFQLYTAAFGVFPGVIQRSVHWGFVSVLILLMRPAVKSGRPLLRWAIDGPLLAVAAYTTIYLVTNYADILTRFGRFTPLDVWLGIAATLLVIEAGRRTLGWPLPLLAAIMLVYAFVGPYMPGLLGHRGYSIHRLATFMFLGTNGIYGIALGVSATFIFLFMLFGAFLEQTGAGKFFVQIAFALTGKARGGPAQAAILSSSLLGMVSGSGVANVATTGQFTIPLMKRTGYQPHFAGAVEAVASNGGQIMPPVMGAVAFLMAEMLGIPYISIAKAAAVPAVLYFVTLSVAVYLEARRTRVGEIEIDVPPLLETLRNGAVFLIPVVILVGLLVLAYSPMKAAFYGIVAVVAVGAVRQRNRSGLREIFGAMPQAARSALPVVAACANAGIIIGIINLTGLGLKLSTLIVAWSHGIPFVALLITMVVSLILGMGLPTSAAYLVLAVLGGPALVELGIPEMSAHLFILYFGALSTITPPVALSAYAAAGIAEANPLKTGVTALRLASVAFIIPFMFVYGDSLLLQGSLGQIVLAILTALIGAFLLSVAVVGWFGGRLLWISRLACGVGALLLLEPGLTSDVLGITFLAALIVARRFQFGIASDQTPPFTGTGT